MPSLPRYTQTHVYLQDTAVGQERRSVTHRGQACQLRPAARGAGLGRATVTPSAGRRHGAVGLRAEEAVEDEVERGDEAGRGGDVLLPARACAV